MHAVLHLAAGSRGGRGLVKVVAGLVCRKQLLNAGDQNLVTVVGKISVRTFSVKIKLRGFLML